MTSIASKDVQNLPVSDQKGVVFAVKGKTVDQNGNSVSVGDNVTKGQVLHTGADSAVLVKFAGGMLVLGHEQQIDISQRLLDLIKSNKVEDSIDEGVDFDRLEQALEEGLNLEDLLPATAAGTAPTSSGSGSAAGAGVRFVLTGEETIPLAGFETNAPGTEFTDPNQQSDAIDSVPEATDDTDSVNSLGVATGNVVTGIDVANGDSNTEDGNADDSGINGFAASVVVGVATGAGAEVSDGSNVGQAFSSDKGTLILNADGSYEYTPFREATGQDVFSYTVSDADGDLSTATLTINIDAIPSLDITPPGPDGSGANQSTVSEAGLPSGTSAGDGSNITEGAIQYFAGDGAATVQIAGINIIVNGELQVSEVQGQFGRLVITSVDANSINYRYELDQAADHSQGSVQENFSVLISDSDGNSADDISSTLTIEILDDTPIAQDQNDAVDVSLQATGNVITAQDVAAGDANNTDGVADQLGADGAGAAVVVGVVSGDSAEQSNTGVGQTIVSDKGTLVLNADGSYQYTANPGAFGEDTFSYTMQDADGSTDVATLVINVDAANILDDGNETTTLLSGETNSGNVLANTDNPDGPDPAVVTSFVFNGTEYQAGESVIVAGVGSLTINADGSYSFGASSGFAGTVPAVQYTVSDGVNEVTSTLNITVIAPNILSDGSEVVTVPEDTVGTGNILANLVNPDGPSETLLGFTVDGSSYTPGQTATISGVGSLFIDTDGSFTFTPELNYNGPVPVVSYSITDGIDTVSSTLSISVGAVNDLSDDDETLSTPEDTPLSDNVLTNSVNPDGPGPAEVTGFTVGGTNYVAGDTATIVDGGVTVGQLKLNSDGSFTFNPANNYAGPVPPVNYTVSDGASSVNSTLNLSVGAVNDLTDGDESVSTNEDTPTSGNVLDNSSNPDGPSPATVTGFSIGGTSYAVGTTVPVTQAGVAIGDFTLNSDGSYTFSPAPNYNGAGPTVDYQVTDGAATVNSQLQITINPVDDGDPSVTISDNNGAATGDESVAENSSIAANNFTISAPDGLASFTIAGQLISAAALANASSSNIIVAGSEGTLTITNYDPSSGVVTYNYDPSGTAKDHSGGEITDAFAVTIEDLAGSTASGVLDILVTDTAPVANADSDSTNAVTNTTGNVRTDVGGADVDGADTATITGVVAGTQTGDISGGVNTSIAGSLGSLTLQADGSYTYTPGAGAAALAEGATATDTFSYTLKDADGSFSTTTVVITVTGTSDGAPTVTIDDNNAGATGDESVAEDGSAAGNTFTISTPDGLGSLSIAGQAITAAALNNASTSNITVNTPEGVLTITDYNSATGEVTYNYDPSGTAKDHSGGEVVDSLAVVVTDSDGTTANGILDILITDTAPVANADTDSTDAVTNATGNVRTDAGSADVDGADAAAITGVVAGTQTGDISGGVNTSIAGSLGSLTLQADGSYTYTPGAGAAALAEGATATDTFSYTLKDADGSFSTTTVVITVTGTSDGAPTVTIDDNNAGATGDESVAEDGSAAGNTFTISTPDGLGSLSIAGQAITAAALNNASTSNITVNTPEGVLTITDYNSATGEVTYNYDPSGTAKDHSGGEVVDSLAVVVTDSDGTTANGILDILITDTAPVANADTDSTDAVTNATGNVRTDAGGADVDGADAAAITGVVAGTQTGDIAGGVNTSIAGSLGSLTLQADGSYTYTPGAGAAALAEGATAADTFSYTLKDSDGSFSTTTVVITVTGTSDGAPTVTIDDNNAGATGDESVQEDGTVTGNTFTINTPDGLGSLSIAGQAITAAALNNASSSNITVNTPEGVLTITDYNSSTGEVTYNYDPSGTAKDHSSGEVVDSLAVVVTDSDGTTANGTLDILITDTAPVANADTDSTDADNNATGNVRTDAGGADVDGADAAAITGVVAGTQTGDISGGVNTSIAGSLGSLTLQADGSYTYTPGAGAAALAEGATATDTFSYTLKDADGSFSTTTVVITVTGTSDGAPTVTIDDNNAGATGDESVAEDGSAAGNTFTISTPDGLGSLSIAGQAITAAALNNASTSNITVNTPEGVLTITDYNSATGEVTYNYDPSGTAKDHSGGEVVDSLAVVVTDSDGTTANGILDILITDTAPVANADTDSTDAVTNATGNVRTDAGGADVDGADAAAITGVVAGTQTGDISGGVNTSIAGSLGSLTLQADGSYTYTPGAGAAALAEGATATDTFSYTLKDADGSFSTTTVVITVTGTSDGAPTVTIDDNNAGATGDESVQEDGAVTGNTFTINTPDGLGSLSIAGQAITAAALNNASSSNITVNTPEGVLTITDYNSATGDVTYNYDPSGTAKDHSGGEVVDSLAVVVTDSDGTTANGTLDILITDTAPVANADTGSTDAVTNATGNVRTDVGGADVDGADAAAITGVVAGTQTGDIAGGVNTSIAGSLGSLTLQADGSYTYTPGVGAAALAEGATATDTFSYTLKDSDGSFSTTTVTITVTGTSDGAPTVTIDDNNAGATGNESVQEDGSVTGNTFTINTPDGLGSLSIAGQAITAAALNNASTSNITVNTPEGVLTITDYNSTTGEVTYNYDPGGTAKDHSGGEVVDSLAVVVTDSDGTTANGTLDILITDTAPIANADTDSTDADNNATGNVRTDAGGADVDGADAAAITGVVAGTQTGDISGGVNTSIAGSLGSLTLQADGSYTYTPGAGAAALAEGATATDTFSYTLKDADGSFSTTTVVITVTGTSDGAPTVTIDDNNAGATGDESVQEDGTATDNTFTISTPDGLDSLSIAGQSIAAAALNNASTSNITVNTPEGVLTITNYNSATGEVTYNYDPNGTAKDHSGGEVVDSLAVVVTDSDGTTANGTLDILITDTAPVANADTDSTDADNNATGNVRTDVGGADVDGADAAAITGVVAGTQTGDITGGVNTAIAGSLGSLTLQADGSYTYTPGAGAAALAEGATATDTFSYTLKDSDGSFSTTTVVITVTGTTDGAPTVTIDDNNAGATGDESVAEDGNTTGNTFTISTPDGLGSLSIAGQNITAAALNNASSSNITVNTPEGVLTITDYNSSTGEVTYNYDPSGTAKDHSSGEVVDSLAVVVTDSDGTTANGTLDILITDTAPVANADTDSTDAVSSATGNVRTDVGGADVDGADAAAITGVVAGTQTGDIAGGVNTSIAGSLGSLTLQADGSYTYTPGAGAAALAEGATATDTFSYTLKDSDGSFSTTTVVITVTGTSDGAPTVTIDDNNAGATGDESVQEDGAVTGNTFTINTPDGLGSLSIAGQAITAAALNNASSSNITVNTPEGVLTITDYNSATGEVTYNYDPSGTAKDHSGGEVVDSLAVVVTDSDGTTANGTLDILITDTAPVANADTDSTDADNNATGNVRTDAGGADVDGADVATVTGVVAGTQTSDISGGVNTSIAGSLGSLTLQADGSYTYAPGAGAAALAEGATATDTFSYTLKDADGSFSTTTVTITVTGTTDGLPTVTITDNNAGATGDESVQEDGTATGNTFTISTPDGLDSLSIAGQSIAAAALNNASTSNITVNTPEGVLTITNYNSATGEVTYNYDPNGTAKDHSGGEVVDSLAVVVTDSDGTTANGTLDILITDTAPVANADTDSTDADNNATGNVRTDVGGADVDGADAAAITGVVAGTQTGDITGGVNTAIAGSLGSLTLQADGSYTYTPGAGAAALAEGATATDTFSYTLKDSDGSFSTTTVVITVTGTTDGAPTVTIDDNNAGATGDESVAEDGNTTGNTFTISTPDGLGSLSIAGQNITAAALNNASSSNITVNTPEGVLTITDYNSTTGEVTYNYDPSGTAKDHSGGEVVDSLAVVVTDSDGTTANGTLDILITDTAPVANADTDSTDADNNATGNVRTDAGGADVDGADAAAITGVVAGTQTGDITGGVNTSIAGSLGSLTLQADGSYTYTPGAGAAALAEGATATDTFSYTLKDADGSFSTTTVTITVTGTTDGLPTVTITDNNAGATGDESVVEDGAATGNTFTISTPDGLGSLSIAGQNITAAALNNASTSNITVNTPEGVLTITDYNSGTGEVTYNYDPSGTAKDHSSGEVVDSLAVVVTDSDGTTANGTLDILITDTAPVANADTDSTDADNNATGNVRTDAGGADVDGADASAITGVVAGTQTGDISGGVNTAIAGSLGSLTLQADGSYTYTPGAAAESLALGVSATDTFSYTLKDADGSFSTTTITITVTGTNQGPQAIASSKSGNEDVAIQLGVSDFGFTDVDTGDQLSSVRIDSLPADGILMLNGVAVTAGQVITAAELNNTTAPNTGLQFVPDQHESGSDAYGGSGTGDQQADYASFTFSVNDGNDWSAAPASFSVDVTPDADAALIDTSLVNYNSGNNQHIDLVEIPSSDRFTREVYNNAATGPQAGNQLENISAGLNGNVSTPAQPYNASGNNGATNIGARQLQKVTSLIYLEEGQTVSFSGYMDDAAKIELGGTVLLRTNGNTWGQYDTATAQTVSQGAGSYTATGTYTAPAAGYYTLETYVYNHSGPGDFSIRIHLDGGGPQALSNSNVVVFRDIDTLEATGAQYSEFVPGPTAGNSNHNSNVGGYYPIELNKGGEGAKIKLSGISVQLQDTDGSESIASITLGNIPDGWEVYDGNTLLFTAGGGNNSVDISSADLNNLFVRSTNSAANGATVDYDLEVTAVVNETANGTVVDTQSSTGTLTVSIFDTQNVSSSPLKKAPEQAQQDAIEDVQESSQGTGKSKTTAGGLLAEQDELLFNESPAADSGAEFSFVASDEPSYAVELQDVLALDKSEQSLDALLPKALETKSVNVKSLEADFQTCSDAPDVLVWNDAISELPEIKTESDLVDII